jgi:hypothetical protein
VEEGLCDEVMPAARLCRRIWGSFLSHIAPHAHHRALYCLQGGPIGIGVWCLELSQPGRRNGLSQTRRFIFWRTTKNRDRPPSGK